MPTALCGWVNAETKLWCSRFPGAPVLEWWPLVSVPDHLPPRDQCLQLEMPSSPKSRWLFTWFTHLLLRVFARTLLNPIYVYIIFILRLQSLQVYQYRPFLHPSSIQIRHCRPVQFRPGQWKHRHRQLRYHFPRPWEHSDHLVQVKK